MVSCSGWELYTLLAGSRHERQEQTAMTIDNRDYEDREEFRWKESGEPRYIKRSYVCICGSYPESICLYGNARGCSTYFSKGRVAPTKTWAVLRPKWLALNPGKRGPSELGREPIAYRAELSVGKKVTFKSNSAALKWLAALEEKFRASNLLCDNDIYTSIELIYLTRWDCPTARLAAA